MAIEITEQALMAEQAVLGSMLIDDSCVGRVLSKIRDSDFLVAANREIYHAIRALFREGTPVDGVTVRGKLGADYGPRLQQLIETTPTSANVMEYAALMHDQAALRRIQDVGQKLQDVATLEEARPIVAEISAQLDEGGKLDIWTADDVLAYFQQRHASPSGHPEYISIGVRALDDGLFLERGDVLVIAGEPSAGKTAFGLLAAYHMAEKYKVGFFSLETRNEKLADRLIAGQMRIDFDRIKRSTLTEDDWQRFAEAGAAFAERRLSLIPCGGINVSGIQAITQACGFDVIFVDYAQLIQSELSDRVGSAAMMADVSKRLHGFAQRSRVTVVELLQLTRPEQRGKWFRPTIHDLKETGQWEQDADSVVLIYHPHPEWGYDRRSTRVIEVAKNKEGRLADGLFKFVGEHQRFQPIQSAGLETLLQKSETTPKKQKSQKSAPTPGQVKLEEIQDDGDIPF